MFYVMNLTGQSLLLATVPRETGKKPTVFIGKPPPDTTPCVQRFVSPQERLHIEGADGRNDVEIKDQVGINSTWTNIAGDDHLLVVGIIGFPN